MLSQLSSAPLLTAALLLLTGGLAPAPASVAGDAVVLPEGYDAKCVRDATKDYSRDNYLDCKTSDAAKEGRTECCTVGGELGCCKPTETGRMLKIAFGIIGVALAIGLVVYICTWCDRDTWPCIGRIEDAWRPRQHKLEESLVCCRDRVERRRMEEEHRRKYAAKGDLSRRGDDDDDNGRGFDEEEIGGGPDEDDSRRANLKLDAPQEFKAPVQDSWF